MKAALCAAIAIIFFSISALSQEKILTTDPITGLPVIGATDSGMHFGNEPTDMPSATVCSSKMKADFYMLYKISTNAAATWYGAHLAGFKQARGFGAGRTQIAFYNSDWSILVIVTGNPGVQGADTTAYSVAYERYQPGLPEKTIIGLAHGAFVCQ